MSTYINRFISNRRKLNLKEELCGAPHLDMPFRTKRKLNILNVAWNEKNLTEDQKTDELRKMGKDFTIHNKIRLQPRKLQMG